MTFETLMMVGSRELPRVPVVMFEAFRDERASPDAIKLPVTVSPDADSVPVVTACEFITSVFM